ncbi:hypothetical protein EV383_4475 [Pseudonocardia sediminis]|uniref:Uncharacterized protein n=1 Tax=Pseudonocardia sediminis TaxID=1397368 RepID=A0A4V2FR72_PSEST|nr:hypothetical protein [Pseudonocardia sediminis]RZT87550.1 hypothetical protein EV383_4475 [Pseudonocardia sediminis]
MTRDLEVGENFESWEHRIDHQLAFAHSRIDIVKKLTHGSYAKAGALSARCDDGERRIKALEHSVARLQAALYLVLVVALLAACVAVWAVVA